MALINAILQDAATGGLVGLFLVVAFATLAMSCIAAHVMTRRDIARFKAQQPAARAPRPHARIVYWSDHARVTYYNAAGRKVTARRVAFADVARVARSLRGRGYYVC